MCLRRNPAYAFLYVGFSQHKCHGMKTLSTEDLGKYIRDVIMFYKYMGTSVLGAIRIRVF